MVVVSYRRAGDGGGDSEESPRSRTPVQRKFSSSSGEAFECLSVCGVCGVCGVLVATRWSGGKLDNLFLL